jgi:hypothetical protein
MSATLTAPAQLSDGDAASFVRGFACCPERVRDGGADVPVDDADPSGARPEFRLTTVQPGLVVMIEVGTLTGGT